MSILNHSAKIIQSGSIWVTFVTLSHAVMECFPESFPGATTTQHPHICSFRRSNVTASNLTTNIKNITRNRTPGNVT